jgi:hypothetical protein
MSSTSTELAQLNKNLLSTQRGGDDVYDSLGSGATFLSRLQLFGKGDAINKNLIGVGRYGIPESGDSVIDLGPEITIIPLAIRPKAMDLSDRANIITVYDVESAEFQRIRAAAMQPNSGCMVGPSFLVIESKTSPRFLEFFCGSKSAAKEAMHIRPFLALTEADIAAKGSDEDPHDARPCTLRVRLAKSKDGKFSWHVPTVHACSIFGGKLPKAEKVADEVAKFLGAQGTQVETVADEDDAPKRRAR